MKSVNDINPATPGATCAKASFLIMAWGRWTELAGLPAGDTRSTSIARRLDISERTVKFHLQPHRTVMLRT